MTQEPLSAGRGSPRSAASSPLALFLRFGGALALLALALALMSPLGRLAGRQGSVIATLLALAGIAVAATSIAFLLISESRPLFGFKESGYRPAIVVALVAEGAAVVLLS